MSTIPMHGAPQDAQSQTSKHPSDAALESSPKRRKTLYQKAEEEASAAAHDVQETIESSKTTFRLLQEGNFDTTDAQITLLAMEQVLRAAIAGKKAFSKAQQKVFEKMLDLRINIPANYPDEPKIQLNRLNVKYAEFSRLFKPLLNSLPPPSEFARPSVWPTLQSSSAGIFCLRPTDNRGLPLCTLHDVFRRFLVRVHEPLPQPSAISSHNLNRRAAAASIRATAMMCREMGDAFYSQGERSEYFHECVPELLPGAVAHHSFNPSSDVASCQVDLVWFGPYGVPICFCKDNYEAGQTGYDIYLYVARCYDLAVKSLRDNMSASARYLERGAPMFLICLLGPILSILGGFADGERVMVEPLGPSCFMLEDFTGSRQRRLEKLLYALAQGMFELETLAGSCIAAPPFPADTPRIYPSCTLYAGNTSEGTLTFKERLSALHPGGRLLFTAVLSTSAPENSQIPVVVKLVNDSYGEEVQQLLARHNLAPVLYGYARPEGAPTAYVMEYLDENWKSLFDLLKRDSSRPFHQAIRAALQRALDLLKEEGLVHGDLRSNNVMVRITDGEPQIKIIDYDWAGKAGQVRYPAVRNESLVWPGEAGGPIQAGDDRKLVDLWWPKETLSHF